MPALLPARSTPLSFFSYHTVLTRTFLAASFIASPLIFAISTIVFRAAGFVTSFFERYADSGKATKKRRKQKLYNIHTTIWEQRLPRARSGCRDDTAIVHATAQAQALLFSKLPLEIRQHIYSYAFCGNQLELRVARDKIEDGKTKPFELMCPAAQQLLGFLGSCKLAYRSWWF
jgi:hypothetical protein